MARNVGYSSIVNISKILRGDRDESPSNEFVAKFSASQIASFKYCPVTSCDVERVFSVYKHILSQRRRKFLFENFKHHLIINCNFHCNDEDDDRNDDEIDPPVIDLDKSAEEFSQLALI